MELETGALLDTTRTLAARLLKEQGPPWTALTELKTYLAELGQSLPSAEYERVAPDVWIARDAKVAASASISGPCVIDHEAEIRHCAYIRGSVLVGKGAVVGNSTELKNALLFDGVQVPHFNYIGDSILGYKAHLGAGAITSNVKSDKTDVVIRLADGGRLQTGMRKLGAIVGDFAEVGCNSVLCPGCVIGRQSIIYPCSCVRGVVLSRHIYKSENAIVPMRESKGGE